MDTRKQHNSYAQAMFRGKVDQHQADFRASGFTRHGWRQRKALLRRLVPFGAEPGIEIMEIMEILDIGCGNGRMGDELCQVLQQRGITTQIDGIDFTERATQIAQTTFGYRDTFIADCTDTPAVRKRLDGRTYQAVLCCEVFHYVHPQDYQNFLTVIHSALQPGGYFLFLFPNLGSLYHAAFKKIAARPFHQNFKYAYQLSSVLGLLQQSGFRTLAVHGSDYLFGLQIKLNPYRKLGDLFAFEIAVLAQKKGVIAVSL